METVSSDSHIKFNAEMSKLAHKVTLLSCTSEVAILNLN